jgi:putative DNA primase/helicase
MDTPQFLGKVLPQQGHYVLVVFTKGMKKPPVHRAFTTIEQLAEAALEADNSGDHTYHACASYADPDGVWNKRKRKNQLRVATNAAFVRSQWLDIDVGPGKDYATRKEALTALRDMCKELGVPAPMIVQSGLTGGLHCYWAFNRDLPAQEDAAHGASAFSAALKSLGFAHDTTRTKDMASILRPVGTHNRKGDPFEVKLLRDAAPIDPNKFYQQVTKFYPPKPLVIKGLQTDWSSGVTHIESLAESPENIDRVRKMLEHIPAECDYSFWRDIIWAIISTGWSCAEELSRDWSITAPDRFDEAKLQGVIESYDPDHQEGITFGTLVHHACQHGWDQQLGHAEEYQGGGGDWNIETGHRFSQRWRDKRIFIHETGDMLTFETAQGWLGCDPTAPDQAAKVVVRQLRHEAAENYKDDPESSKTKHLLQLAKHSSRVRGYRDMLESAKSEPGMSVSLNQFDQAPMLLGVRNGVLDLSNQTLLPVSPEILVSKRCCSAYDPTAACPRFDQFLEEILPDRIIRAFMLKLLGHFLTGDVGEQIFIFFYGHGANGKSVLIELLAWVLGDYSQHIATEMLMTHQRNPQAPSPDIVALKGKRLAFANETTDGRRLDDARVKELTGGDTLSGRPVHGKHNVTFSPTHKLVMVGNHKPTITDLSQGMWRRVVLIPFEVTIPEHSRDPKLLVKLQAEAPGILNRMLAGLNLWRANGLQIPDQIRAATTEYRNEMDIVLGWLEDCCTVAPEKSCVQTQLYESYRQWCWGNGHKPISKTKFTRQLGDRQITVAPDKRRYLGVGLGR